MRKDKKTFLRKLVALETVRTAELHEYENTWRAKQASADNRDRKQKTEGKRKDKGGRP